PRAVVVGGPDEPPGADLAGPADHGGGGDRDAGLDRGGDLPHLGEGLPADRLDEDVDDAAAGQADGEGGVVADPVALQHGLPGGGDFARQIIDGAVDAAAGDAAHDLARTGHGHGGAGLAGRA